MNPELQLLQLYDRWRVLTEAERGAIAGANWTRLAEVQRQKQQLQEAILQAGQAADELSEPAAAGPVEQRHRELGAQLISLEQENARALAEQRRVLKQQEQVLDQTSRNLSQVHRAYAHGRGPAWQSYS